VKRKEKDMRTRTVSRRSTLGALAATSLGISFSEIVRSAPRRVTRSHVRALLDQYVAKRKIAGAVAAIGRRAGADFVSVGRVAFSDHASACDPDSLWRIYSMTKLVTGAAAMLLIDEGKLTLDMPVEQIFPTFRGSRVLISPNGTETRNAESIVTIRHLMTHSSGLVGSLVAEPPLGPLYADRELNVARVSLEADSTAQHQSSLLAFAAAAGTVPLAFDPGTQWSYGISSDVLGGVIEKISEVPFDQFLEKRLLGPLGMRDTGWVVRPGALSRFATNYEVSEGGMRPLDAPPQTIFAKEPPFPFPSSGLVSSARDYARFASMLLGEGASGRIRVLGTEAARIMMSNLLPNGVRANFGMGWGAGGAVLMSSTPTPTPFGRTEGTYGWEGAAGTLCWVDRTQGLYAVLMAQYMPTEAYNLPSEFSAAVFADHV
jgi:CubicO group peptidase (beta-lactamase class C family)